MKKITQIVHEIVKEKLTDKDTAIDFTCGSGNDTLVLASLCHCVHAYDIQQEALDEAQINCQMFDHIQFHHKSHYYFDEDVKKYKVGIFNLGYYPKGNHEIVTEGNIVCETLEKALLYLESKGIIILVCYPGFEHGFKEAQMIEDYVLKLPSRSYDVFRFQLVNRQSAPYILGIEKH